MNPYSPSAMSNIQNEYYMKYNVISKLLECVGASFGLVIAGNTIGLLGFCYRTLDNGLDLSKNRKT